MSVETNTYQSTYRRGIKYRNDLMLERRARGLSRKQAASLVGRSARTIRRYESGRMLPPLLTALKLEILYRTPLAGLYHPIYQALTRELRAKEEALLSRRTQRRGV